MQHNGDINQIGDINQNRLEFHLLTPPLSKLISPLNCSFFILKMFITQGCCEDLWTWVNMPQSVCHTVDPL